MPIARQVVFACAVALTILRVVPVGIAGSRQDTPPHDANAEVDQLIQDLVSADLQTAKNARKQLEAMGEPIAPRLFARLVAADWSLKQPLLDVLVTHDRDFAKNKLFTGTEEEKTFAAILFELITCEDNTDIRAQKAMVNVLIRALKSPDKNLRAAACHALIFDYSEYNTRILEHFHEITAAMISSFDTDLVMGRRTRAGPVRIVLSRICLWMDIHIGDRMAYSEARADMWKKLDPVQQDSPSLRRAMRELLARNNEAIVRLRVYWRDWWADRSSLSLTELGRQSIDRNIGLLSAEVGGETAHSVLVSLDLWTNGMDLATPADWAAWWDKHRTSYRAPLSIRD